MLQAGGSPEPRGAGSHAEVILSQPAWRSGEDEAGEEGWAATPLPPQPLPQPAVDGPGTPGAFPEEAPCFFTPLWHVPPRGSAAAVAQLRALGFINNAAQRWGPTQLPVTLGHPVWCVQLAVLWQSPLPPFQLTLPLLLCEPGPEAQPLWAGPRAQECGRTQKPLSFCLISQPSQVNWQLAQQIQAGEGWAALQGPPPFHPSILQME